MSGKSSSSLHDKCSNNRYEFRLRFTSQSLRFPTAIYKAKDDPPIIETIKIEDFFRRDRLGGGLNPTNELRLKCHLISSMSFSESRDASADNNCRILSGNDLL